jgi:hypothetical protein
MNPNNEEVLEVEETPCTSLILDQVLKKLENSVKQIKGYVAEVRSLKKEIIILEKQNTRLVTKRGKKKKVLNPDEEVNENKRKNGFARPVLISKELSEFLRSELLPIIENEEVGENEAKVEEQKKLIESVKALSDENTSIARTDVTKLINKYIKYHKLQDPEAKKHIILENDAGLKLKSILSDVTDEEGEKTDLTFINIQKYIKHQFPKKEEEEPAKEKPAPVPKEVPVPEVSTPAVEVPEVPVAPKEEEPKEEGIKKTVILKKKLKRPMKKKITVET